MGLLGRDQILGASDLETKDVEVPEWGGTVRLRQLTVAEVEDIGDFIEEDGEPRRGAVKLVVLAAVDASGDQLFTREDVERLAEKSARAVLRVAKVAREFSAMNEDADEELEGNSEAGPSEGPSSA